WYTSNLLPCVLRNSVGNARPLSAAIVNQKTGVLFSPEQLTRSITSILCPVRTKQKLSTRYPQGVHKVSQRNRRGIDEVLTRHCGRMRRYQRYRGGIAEDTE